MIIHDMLGLLKSGYYANAALKQIIQMEKSVFTSLWFPNNRIREIQQNYT